MMMDSKLLLGVAALCAVFSLSAEAKLFKWVDANGTTHYGETIPPEFADREAVKLEKGRVEKREDRNEELKRRQLERGDPVAEKARIEAERHDNALLNTYSSEKEIDLARDRNLLQVQARTNSYSALLQSSKENLAGLLKELEAVNQQGRKVPKSLEDDLTDAKESVAKMQTDLDNSLKEQEAVKARYAADKERYRKLKGLTPIEVAPLKPIQN
ncbi:MAG: DUF4124 domain-containing protein [Sideroxydans sp.]|nr:DUF4124 domain-containing protein [Sideroxydans sp.]